MEVMQSRKILIIEDDEDIRFQMALALEDEGYSVLAASNGQAALDLLKSVDTQQLPDLIILDLMMPIMDGELFLEKLSSLDEKVKNIKVIIASAKGTSIDPKILSQVVGRIQKPMELDSLYEMINTHLTS
jgi:two-component system, OmpR family, response regulator CpxR